MTTYSDIANGRVSYTCKAGWIDWGHADGVGAGELIDMVKAGHSSAGVPPNLDVRLNGFRAAVIDYKQTMGGFVPNTGIRIDLPAGPKYWIVQKNLSGSIAEAVALGIFMAASVQFETWQRYAWGFVTGSGMSAEDLVSNLVGFHRAANNLSREQTAALLGEVSTAESQRIWKDHLGDGGLEGLKNTSFDPIYFQSEDCSAGANQLPAEIRRLTPSPEGLHWVRPRYQGGQFWNVPFTSNSTFNFRSNGSMRIE